ncbi:DEAD-box ATP-dependent RNA helicase 13-like, partial [Carica papaya]|uniref:DEAD-box ATP-dependent RNA helicase 13-like n=1 Tax=Carica papaya TaxID=3649 RepID=UPI000B8C8C97
MSTEKQERLLNARPEIIVGTPGRLWELMSKGEKHLVELHSLSFFVLDEADRMIENGHFRELQSIIDMLPMANGSTEGQSQYTENCVTVSNLSRKKRQTFVFSATIALSADFRKKLKRGSLKSKESMSEGVNSIENLSERAGMRANVAIVDLTTASILAHKLEESFIECREEDKNAYLYYILSVHGQGRTIIFCTSIAALRHISAILRILGINVWTLHAQMQQRARLKAIDRFRANDHGILVATDVAARGLDIPGVRSVIHYQLPHSAEVYVHRSGRTARASSDGCSIALISSRDTSKFASLCKSFSKESVKRFPLDNSYMPEVMKRLSLARQIDKILRKDSQEKAMKSWFERNAESVELLVENNDSEEERVNNYKKKKISSMQLKKLQQELNMLISRPLQPKTFSHRYLAGV